VPGGDYYVTIGSARVSRPGKDVSVYAYGMMHTHVLRVADLAARRGVEAEVVDLRTLAPLDRETVLTSVQKTGKALIVHEDNLTGGYGAELAALIAEEAFTALDAPVRRLATSDSRPRPSAAHCKKISTSRRRRSPLPFSRWQLIISSGGNMPTLITLPQAEKRKLTALSHTGCARWARRLPPASRCWKSRPGRVW
jgi:hypothetical protein